MVTRQLSASQLTGSERMLDTSPGHTSGELGSPTTLGPPCSRASGILCGTQPALGASWSWGDASLCPREPGAWLSPHRLRARVSPQGAGTHMTPGRRCSRGCCIWKKFSDGSGGTHGPLCGRPPPTWGLGDGRPRQGWEHPSLELRSPVSEGLSFRFCLGCIMRSFAYCSVRSIKMNF